MQTYENFINLLKQEIHNSTGIPLSNMNYVPHQASDTCKEDRLTVIVSQTKLNTQTCSVHIWESYEQYTSGVSARRIADCVKSKIDELHALHVDNVPTILMNYETAKPNLFAALINIARHKDSLDSMVYYQIADMTMVLSYRLSDPLDDSLISLKVPRRIFESWQQDKRSVFQDALQNTCKATPPRVYPLKMVLENPTTDCLDLLSNNDNLFKDRMIGTCISTITKTNGAIAVFLPGVAQRIAEDLDSNFYVAFTSQHEAMIHSVNDVDAHMLYEVLSETIRTSVNNDEFLSNQILHYDRNTTKFTCAGM